MNKEKIARIIYYELIPIIAGFFFFGSLGRVTDTTDFIRKMITFAMYIIPMSFIYVWIGGFIFSRLFPKDTLARRLMLKMERCNIRKERGRDYCAECHDGYNCAASIGISVDYGKDLDKMIRDKDKGDVVK